MIYAKYTVVLKTLLEAPEGKEAIDNALSTYPLYEPHKLYDLIPSREELNRRLLDHYKYREIGFEAPGRFVDELRITMNEIMPRYNELFKTVEVMAELPSPFDNVDVVETYEEKRTGSSSSTGTSESKNKGTATEGAISSSKQTMYDKHLESDTPQGNLGTTAKNIDAVGYASKANWGKSESEGEGSTTTEREAEDAANSSMSASGSTTEEVKHTFTKVGNQGVNTYAHDMNEFRTSIIDVVDQIIHDPRIAELFMLVY